MGVVPHAVLADPDRGGPAFSEQDHGLLTDIGAGPEQQCAERPGRDANRGAGTSGGDGVGVPVDHAMFEIHEREPILHTSELGQRGEGEQAAAVAFGRADAVSQDVAQRVEIDHLEAALERRVARVIVCFCRGKRHVR